MTQPTTVSSTCTSPQPDYRARREALLQQLATGVMLVSAAPVSMRNGDVEHSYRQSSDLFYLTGFEESHCVLVLSGVHADYRAVLFLEDRDPDVERWHGSRLGVQSAPAVLGVDQAFPLAALEKQLPDLLKNCREVHLRLGHDPALDAQVLQSIATLRRRSRLAALAPTRLVDLSETLHEARLFKDESELATLRRAGQLAAAAHRETMATCRPGLYEYELEATLLSGFRRGGALREAYESIVASGPNANVLHYRGKQRQLVAGELVLVDAGCELDGYAADITRTFPVSGRFSAEQRAVYEIVLAAQQAAIDATKPGVTLTHVHMAAVRVIVAGLIDLKVLKGSIETNMETGGYQRFFMHRTSHWLGLDVHDVGGYHKSGSERTLSPGLVLTVEPGLYFADVTDVEARWHGIGVRIEDDVIVTAQGAEAYTLAAPKSVAAIESCMASKPLLP